MDFSVGQLVFLPPKTNERPQNKINGWFRCMNPIEIVPFLGDMLVFGGVVGQSVCCECFFFIILMDLFSFWKESLKFWLVRHDKILCLGMFFPERRVEGRFLGAVSLSSMT